MKVVQLRTGCEVTFVSYEQPLNAPPNREDGSRQLLLITTQRGDTRSDGPVKVGLWRRTGSPVRGEMYFLAVFVLLGTGLTVESRKFEFF